MKGLWQITPHMKLRYWSYLMNVRIHGVYRMETINIIYQEGAY